MFKLMLGVLIGFALVAAGWWYYSDGGKRDPVDGFTDAVKYQTREATKAVTDKIEESLENVKEGISDATILATVKAKLLKEKSLSGLDIDVDVEDGKVNLSGTVPHPDARATAIRLVRETDGVKKYSANLKVVRPKNEDD